MITFPPPEEAPALTESSPHLELRVVCEDGGVMPTRGRPADVGLDLKVRSIKRDHRNSDLVMFIADLGVRVEPPRGYYVELVPRSSLAWSGFVMPNSVGVIDPDYRGVLLMPLIHLGDPARAEARAQSLVGARIGQLILRRVERADVIEIQRAELSETSRGEGRFGSSGRD